MQAQKQRSVWLDKRLQNRNEKHTSRQSLLLVFAANQSDRLQETEASKFATPLELVEERAVSDSP